MPEPMSQDLPAGALRDAAAQGGIATPEFIAALLVDGDDDLAAWAIGQALEEQPRAVVFDLVVCRAMELVGSRWESGQWSVSQEHLASVALMEALARLRPESAAETRIGPVAVLAAPEGEEHVAGLACLAQILEERGWRAENLGANVPADGLQRFVAGRAVDLVALSIGTGARLPALRRTIERLRAAEEQRGLLPIMVGGHGMASVEGEIAGASHVSPSLVDAQQFIETLGARLGLRHEG